MLRTQTGRQTTSDVTHFIVIKPTNDNAGNCYDQRKASDAMALVNLGSNSSLFRGSTSAAYSTTISYSTSNLNIIVLQAGVNKYATYLNGSLTGSGTPTLDMPAADSAYTTIGALSDINYGVNATSSNQILYTQSSEICEVLMYNSYVTTNERQQIEGYLSWKWGLQGPSTTITYTPFTPTTISGCALWFDAADSSTLTLSGSNVTQWNDKSGNGRNTSSALGTSSLVSNAINNYPAVYFNTTAFTGSFPYTGTQLHCFVVCTMANNGINARVLSVGNASQTDFGNATTAIPFCRGGSGTTQIITVRNNTNAIVSFAGYNTPFLSTSAQYANTPEIS